MKKEDILPKLNLRVGTTEDRYFVYKKGTDERLNIARWRGDFSGFPTEKGCRNVMKSRFKSMIMNILMNEYNMSWNDSNISKMSEDLVMQLLPKFEIRKVVFTF